MYALSQVGLAIVGVYLLYTALQDRKSIFYLHPSGMSIAFLICLPSAIEFMKQRSGAYKSKSPSTPIIRHAFLHLVSFVTSAIGLAAIYISKEDRKKPHFATWHGKIGIACLVLFLLTALGGLKDLAGHGLIPWKNAQHRNFAKVVFVGLMSECILGLFSNWGIYNFGNNGVIALSSLIGVSTLGVLFLNQRKSGASEEVAEAKKD